MDRHTLRRSPPRLTHRPTLRLVLALAVSYHALIALTCYALHVRALLGVGIENWLLVGCFLSAAPGMIPACILLDRAGITTRTLATPREQRVTRARLWAFTGRSTWPVPLRLAFAYIFIAVLLTMMLPGAHRQRAMFPLCVCAFLHLVPAAVFFHTFRNLRRTSGS